MSGEEAGGGVSFSLWQQWQCSVRLSARVAGLEREKQNRKQQVSEGRSRSKSWHVPQAWAQPRAGGPEQDREGLGHGVSGDAVALVPTHSV